METIDFIKAQADIDALRRQDKIKRRLRKDAWLDLRPYTGEILAWCHSYGGSKYKVQRMLRDRYPSMKDVSADRIYRFVLSINGCQWPNAKKSKLGGN